MPPISSTVSQRCDGAGASGALVHSVCAVDETTLIFAIAARASATQFSAAVFPHRRTAAAATATSEFGHRPPAAAPSPAETADSVYALLLAHSRAALGDEAVAAVDTSGATDTAAAAAAAVAGARAMASTAMQETAASRRKMDGSSAALRATQALHGAHLDPGSSGTPSPTTQHHHPAAVAIEALHIVRQEAARLSPRIAGPLDAAAAAAAAAAVSMDVLCCFASGDAAVASFVLTYQTQPLETTTTTTTATTEWSAQLRSSTWIPSPTKTSTGTAACASRLEVAGGAPLASALVRRRCRTVAAAETRGGCGDGHDGDDAALELLVVWRSTTLVSQCGATPALGYAHLHHTAATDATALVAVGAAPVWRLHAWEVFDMGDLLHGGASPASASRGALPRGGVRSLQWLPDTWDAVGQRPLLAALYAAPATGGVCLDTLAVCCLRHDGRVAEAAHDRPAAPLLLCLTGRLSLGPWSVRGLTLAHPRFLFATALAAPPRVSSAAPPATSAAALRLRSRGALCAAPTAAEAFRAARDATAANAATAVLGVFLRPAHTPFVSSSLLRRSGSDAAAAAAAAALAFPFVLYGASGEVARCQLGGYIECAQTSWCTPHDAAPAGLGHGAHDVGDSSSSSRGTHVPEQHPVARICALLSAPRTASSPAAPAPGHAAVVLTISAQWAAPSPVFGEERREGRRGSLDYGHSAARWSFAVHVTHHLQNPSMSLPPPSPPPPSLALTDDILCWRTSPAAATDTAVGDVGVLLLRGYAASTWTVAGAGQRCDETRGILHDGVFELRLTSCAAAMAHGAGAGVAAAAASPVAELRPWGIASGCSSRPVSAAAFAAVLEAAASTADARSTATDLLSHTPADLLVPGTATAALGAAAGVGGAVPVALAWVGGGGAARLALPECSVTGLDVVALLRSGDVVGWRCARAVAVPAVAGGGAAVSRDDAVQHLGALRYQRRTGDGDVPLASTFLDSLLGRGAGVRDVRMEVVAAPPGDTDAVRGCAVLLLLAVDTFVGVVDLSAGGAVVCVMDVRLPRSPAGSPDSSVDTAPADADTSRWHLQRLPVVSSSGWLTARAGACDGDAGAAVGTSWWFLCTGLARRRAVHPSSRQSCVLRLSYTHWEDVSAAASAGAADAPLPGASDVELPPPAPLVELAVDDTWPAEAAPGLRHSLAPLPSILDTCAVSAGVGWLSCAARLPTLCLCDAVVVHALWPGAAAAGAHSRPPLRLLQWGCRHRTPSSLFLTRVCASCAMAPAVRDDDDAAAGGAAADTGNVALHHVSVSHLGNDSGPQPSPAADSGGGTPEEVRHRRILDVSALVVLDVDGGEPGESCAGAVPGVACDPATWHVLLCTLRVSGSSLRRQTRDSAIADDDAAAHAAATAAGDAGTHSGMTVSYLLCGVPGRPSLPHAAAASDVAAPSCCTAVSWHWIPLCTATAPPQPLAVAQVLPLRSAAAAAVATGADPPTASQRSNFLVAAAPGNDGEQEHREAWYCVTVHGRRLQRRLQDLSAHDTASATAAERVYMYATVDPTLVRVSALS
ncbi:hypothetical protein NESM_000659900 [Novymonas esmeraldas]|uniref:RAVE complex protein Rav1 C-terminal domain-containing protein n=1 Tax=Novymonas esmeraldas TaxID=1808958 RepID=A0AAW0ESG1_9TRYP